VLRNFILLINLLCSSLLIKKNLSVNKQSEIFSNLDAKVNIKTILTCLDSFKLSKLSLPMTNISEISSDKTVSSASSKSYSIKSATFSQKCDENEEEINSEWLENDSPNLNLENVEIKSPTLIRI
jgi:hypothetical protein